MPAIMDSLAGVMEQVVDAKHEPLPVLYTPNCMHLLSVDRISIQSRVPIHPRDQRGRFTRPIWLEWSDD